MHQLRKWHVKKCQSKVFTMNDIEKQYARIFNSVSGKQVLNHLRSITIERRCGQNMTDSELRWWAAQNALVHQIESLIQRGNNLT